MRRSPALLENGEWVDAVVGYRAWAVETRSSSGSVLLRSTTYEGEVWDPDAAYVAKCRVSPLWGTQCGDAPASHHTCGIHAYDRPSLVLRQFRQDCWLTGEVLLWGKVIEHDAGYRAQFARVGALYSPEPADLWRHDTIAWGEHPADVHERMLHKLESYTASAAARYKVPIIQTPRPAVAELPESDVYM